MKIVRKLKKFVIMVFFVWKGYNELEEYVMITMKIKKILG